MGEAALPDPAQCQHFLYHRVAVAKLAASRQPIDDLAEPARQIGEFADLPCRLGPEQQSGVRPEAPERAIAVRGGRLGQTDPGNPAAAISKTAVSTHDPEQRFDRFRITRIGHIESCISQSAAVRNGSGR